VNTLPSTATVQPSSLCICFIIAAIPAALNLAALSAT